jgi:hypothetical protein
MNLLAIALLAQLAAPTRQTLPVLAFPEPGLDDSAAYHGYQTRFYRDAMANTVQIYLDGREGRVVTLLADAENASVGFSARDAEGRPAALQWNGDRAGVTVAGRTRTFEYHLAANVPVQLGWFLLGSMRVERDFQYEKRHRAPFASAAFSLPETDRLVAALGRLAPEVRRRHLALIGARDMDELRARLRPTIATSATRTSWVARVVQPSLDGRDTMVIEVRTDPRVVEAVRAGDSLSLRARTGTRVPFTVRIGTTGRTLTPLARREIFNADFLAFLDSARAAPGDAAALRARWLERQVRGFELLASREKLMAGLPNYATYFGRDMLLTVLMMRPVLRDAMSEFAVASALRKLSPRGDVSHEEALGGQAVREAASEYAALVDEQLRATREGRRAAADSLLALSAAVLHDMRRVRENYHMIDAEFQLPVLAARWLADPGVPAARKRAFLLDATDGEPRVHRLLRELSLVSKMTAAYAGNPVASNLVSFAPRDSGWGSASWRDSGAGYGGGRYAMDVNAIWVPHALEATVRILSALRALDLPVDSLTRSVHGVRGTPLERYVRDSGALRTAIAAWGGASRHFLVRLGPDDLRARVAARLAAMPPAERDYWQRIVDTSAADRDSLTFLAVSLDGDGRPIGVANSDPATRLFLGDHESDSAPDPSSADAVLRDVTLFARPYPVGLFIERVGPVVANDAYAQPTVWRAFERDSYHGPRVVWGREVNLFLLGTADRIADGADDPALAPHLPELRAALERVRAAVQASGFRSELWSHELRDGRVIAVRYGTGSDVQLWSTSDLAVQFALSRLGSPTGDAGRRRAVKSSSKR